MGANPIQEQGAARKPAPRHAHVPARCRGSSRTHVPSPRICQIKLIIARLESHSRALRASPRRRPAATSPLEGPPEGPPPPIGLSRFANLPCRVTAGSSLLARSGETRPRRSAPSKLLPQRSRATAKVLSSARGGDHRELTEASRSLGPMKRSLALLLRCESASCWPDLVREHHPRAHGTYTLISLLLYL